MIKTLTNKSKNNSFDFFNLVKCWLSLDIGNTG